MSLNYCLRDAERWAAFSGDYNPIHFDTAEANRLGMERICVHGMRAMLDVKSALSQAIDTDALSSDSVLFSCRLREPVLCGTPYELPVSETSGAGGIEVSGKLCNATTHRISLKSKLSEAHAQERASLTAVGTLRGASLGTLYEQFKSLEIATVPLWTFYDALLFRLLVNAPETLATVQNILPQHSANSLKAIFTLVQVVQTHHETRFPRQMLQHAGDTARFDDLHYAIQPTLVMGEKETGLVFVAGILAWQNNGIPIAVEVTLKTGPIAE